jgi:hypothetical protein
VKVDRGSSRNIALVISHYSSNIFVALHLGALAVTAAPVRLAVQ